MPASYGSFQLTSPAKLPNVTVAFPGEHWSNRKASVAITPGDGVMPVSSGGKLYVARAVVGDSGGRRIGIALRTVQIPDVNTGPNQLGPNEIMNTVIAVDEYVHVWMSGAFHLTLQAPGTAYVPGDLMGWDPAGARCAGKTGTGSWVKVGAEANAFLEVMEFRQIGPTTGEGILTCRSLRTQR